MGAAARLSACAALLALVCCAAVATTSAAPKAQPKPQPKAQAKPQPRTWPKTVCGKLVPTVRSLSGVQVQANLPKQGPANALDCRYTAGGIDSAFLLESKSVDTTWLTRSQAQVTKQTAGQTCGDAAIPAAAPAAIAGLGNGAFGVDACPGATFTSKDAGLTAVYVLKGTNGWWIVAEPPYATTTVAKLTALLRKLLALYP